MQCHSAATFTDNQVHDVGTGGAYKTPSLVGVGHRSRLMHNGCAASLEERFTACGGSAHGSTQELNEEEMKHLLTYLRSS